LHCWLRRRRTFRNVHRFVPVGGVSHRVTIGVIDEVLVVTADAGDQDVTRLLANRQAARAATRLPGAAPTSARASHAPAPCIGEVDQAGGCAPDAVDNRGGTKSWTLPPNSVPVLNNPAAPPCDLADTSGKRHLGAFEVAYTPLIPAPSGRIEFFVHAPPSRIELYLRIAPALPGCAGKWRLPTSAKTEG
jgi:hypothetical protein